MKNRDKVENLNYQFGKAGLDGTNIQVSSFPVVGNIDSEAEIEAMRFDEDGLTGAKKESDNV